MVRGHPDAQVVVQVPHLQRVVGYPCQGFEETWQKQLKLTIPKITFSHFHSPFCVANFHLNFSNLFETFFNAINNPRSLTPGVLQYSQEQAFVNIHLLKWHSLCINWFLFTNENEISFALINSPHFFITRFLSFSSIDIIYRVEAA